MIRWKLCKISKVELSAHTDVLLKLDLIEQKISSLFKQWVDERKREGKTCTRGDIKDFIEIVGYEKELYLEMLESD